MTHNPSVAHLVANPPAFTCAVLLVIAWAVATAVVLLKARDRYLTDAHRDPSRRSGLLHRERGRHAAPRRAIWRRGAA